MNPIALVALFSIVVVSTSPAHGQRQPLPPAGQIRTEAAQVAAPDGGLLEHLNLLPSDTVPVRFAADSLDRAARFQWRLVALHELLRKLVDAPLGWRGAAVTEGEWRALGIARPWGVAARTGSGTFLVPAAGDPTTVATARRLLGGELPPLAGNPFFGSVEEGASLVLADTLLDLEAARAFLSTAAVRGESPWIDGVVSHLVARLGWEVNEPGRLLEIVGLFDRLAAAQETGAARPLAGYSPAMPYEPSLWYEAQFVRGADAIWVAEGRRGTLKLLKRWIRDREPIRAAVLDKQYPALAVWRSAAFGTGGS